MKSITDIPFYGKIVLAVIIVMAVSQFAPKVTNYFLVLVLIGILLSKSEIFGSLFTSLGFSAGKGQ